MFQRTSENAAPPCRSPCLKMNPFSDQETCLIRGEPRFSKNLLPTRCTSAELRCTESTISRLVDNCISLRHELWTGAGLRHGSTSFRLQLIVLVIAIAIAQAAAMHRLHRFADDFFDSHFFALRFSVCSQCPKFDSQTAMRYRVNYSLTHNLLFYFQYFLVLIVIITHTVTITISDFVS